MLILLVFPASAQERLCDPSFEDCYTPLLNAVRAENTGIDMAFYWIELPDLADAIIKRFQAGVPVRLIVEPRASAKFPTNQTLLDRFKAAGIPMRFKLGDGIVHSKMLLLAGQNRVVFSGSNFGDADVRPFVPLANYVDGAWYFSDDAAVVNSFKTRYDDTWTNTTLYGDYGNIVGALSRRYPTLPIDPSLNFLPNQNFSEDYSTRTIAQIDLENKQIDLTMYRLTDPRICDALLRAVARGVQVRLLAEPSEYRFDASRTGAEFTGPYNVDRLFTAGVQIKMRKHLGLTHQKSLVLYGRGLTIFGSSNWSQPSFNFQEEHNYFTTKPWFFQWFVDQFNRKWNSATEYEPFVPQAPTAPTNLAPTNGGLAGLGVLLKWEGGPWAAKYDVFFGRNGSNLSLIATDVITGSLGPSASETYLVSGLQNGVGYCWRVVGKTMANQSADGPTWCFTASSSVPSATALPPGPMELLLDSSGPAIDQLASLDSVRLLRDPFPVISTNLLNLSTDQNTRVIVFARNLQLLAGETASAVTVNLVDGNNQVFNVAAETVRPVANTDFVQVIFRLPGDLGPGKCTLTLKAHGQLSNSGSIRIKT
ncbi:MAG TPA: phospholipase D-like domain-containing protein [Pyrinomonadaceae bacterium]|nr:phospholipase D-like domain-containing protein [Pyrinomonadaceae bacterium]